MKFYLLFFVISLLSTQVDNKKLTQCPDQEKFEYCRVCSEGECLKCSKGYYILNGVCFETCPKEYVADNYSMMCKKHCNEAVYIKAYTVSKCINQCGVEYSDCSCDLNCKRKGNCCSDFKLCELIQENYNEEDITKTIANCKFDSLNHQTCLQCEDGYYYYNNSCFKDCPKGTRSSQTNNLCLDLDDNTTCENGYFKYQDSCVLQCPIGSRANRINFSCQPIKQYAFYWIFPSKNSCSNYCGGDIDYENRIEIKRDCSCHHTCMRKGNCCDDFEKYCEDENKKVDCDNCEVCEEGFCQQCKPNSQLIDNNCVCKNGFTYDFLKDICVTKIVNTQNSGGKNIGDINKNPSSTFDFPDIFSAFMPNNNENKNLMAFNGNSTINVYKGNKNLKVVTRNARNVNSYNNKKHIIDNLGSKNILKGNEIDPNNFLKNIKWELHNDLSNIQEIKANFTELQNLNENLEDQNGQHKVNKVDCIEPQPNKTIFSEKNDNNQTKIIHHKNVYVHNNIFVNDNSLSMLNPKNPYILSLNKTINKDIDYETDNDKIKDEVPQEDNFNNVVSVSEAKHADSWENFNTIESKPEVEPKDFNWKNFDILVNKPEEKPKDLNLKSFNIIQTKPEEMPNDLNGKNYNIFETKPEVDPKDFNWKNFDILVNKPEENIKDSNFKKVTENERKEQNCNIVKNKNNIDTMIIINNRRNQDTNSNLIKNKLKKSKMIPTTEDILKEFKNLNLG